MKAVKTETANAVFTKEGCFDLPGTRYKYDDGTPGIETCWELSDEELEQVIKDRRIYVYMMGQTVAPMFISVKSEIKFEPMEENTKQHLCSSCKNEFPTCSGKPEFGDGLGNDNVFKCNGYEPKEGGESDEAEPKNQ